MDAPTEITLFVRHKGQVYSRHHTIYYTDNGPCDIRELEYQAARSWAIIKRDIEFYEKQARATNPFAWS